MTTMCVAVSLTLEAHLFRQINRLLQLPATEIAAADVTDLAAVTNWSVTSLDELVVLTFGRDR